MAQVSLEFAPFFMVYFILLCEDESLVGMEK